MKVSLLRNAQLWGGLVWLAFGAFIACHGYELGLGVAREPGSGFAIFWLGLFTAAFALSIILQRHQRRQRATSHRCGRAHAGAKSR